MGKRRRLELTSALPLSVAKCRIRSSQASLMSAEVILQKYLTRSAQLYPGEMYYEPLARSQ